MNILRCCGAVILALFVTATANADLIFAFNQVGTDVVLSANGDVTFTISPSSGAVSSFSQGAIGGGTGPGLAVGSATATSVDVYDHWNKFNSVPAFSDLTTKFLATTGSGDTFGFSGSQIYVPTGYVNGTSLSGTATWKNTTLADLGIPSGYENMAMWNNGAIWATITAPAVAVPEPSTMALAGIGAAVFGLYMSRRRQQQIKC